MTRAQDEAEAIREKMIEELIAKSEGRCCSLTAALDLARLSVVVPSRACSVISEPCSSIRWSLVRCSPACAHFLLSLLLSPLRQARRPQTW